MAQLCNCHNLAEGLSLGRRRRVHGVYSFASRLVAVEAGGRHLEPAHAQGAAMDIQHDALTWFAGFVLLLGDDQVHFDGLWARHSDVQFVILTTATCSPRTVERTVRRCSPTMLASAAPAPLRWSTEARSPCTSLLL